MNNEKFVLEKIEIKKGIYKLKFKNIKNEINIERTKEEFEDGDFIIGNVYKISYEIIKGDDYEKRNNI